MLILGVWIGWSNYKWSKFQFWGLPTWWSGTKCLICARNHVPHIQKWVPFLHTRPVTGSIKKSTNWIKIVRKILGNVSICHMAHLGPRPLCRLFATVQIWLQIVKQKTTTRKHKTESKILHPYRAVRILYPYLNLIVYHWYMSLYMTYNIITTHMIWTDKMKTGSYNLIFYCIYLKILEFQQKIGLYCLCDDNLVSSPSLCLPRT